MSEEKLPDCGHMRGEDLRNPLVIRSWTWFGWRRSVRVGIFRLHEPHAPFEYLPVIRPILDWRELRHKQRRSMLPLLIEKGASLAHLWRWMKTGDSGNINVYEYQQERNDE